MGWTWKDDAFSGFTEEGTELEMARREPAVEMVARRLAKLQDDREKRGFERQSLAEQGLNDEPDFDDDEEEKAYHLRAETMVKLERAEELALYAQLDQLGARMMRPYEHWNEDERLMAYLERDR